MLLGEVGFHFTNSLKSFSVGEPPTRALPWTCWGPMQPSNPLQKNCVCGAHFSSEFLRTHEFTPRYATG